MFKTQFIKNAKWILVCLVFLTFSVAQAQTYKTVAKLSGVKIEGTSSIHAWESSSNQVSGEMVLTETKSGKDIHSLIFRVPVKSIKSGKGLMDSKTYDAFDSDKNPLITFQLTDASEFKISGKEVDAAITGNLIMAGFTKKINIKSSGKILSDGSIQFTGSVPIKMSDFKMKPPTAMMGALKTGDAVTVKFDVTFK
jgi:polyisoprenoid-binding protein YceI